MDYRYNLKTKLVMCSFSIKVLYAKKKQLPNFSKLSNYIINRLTVVME